MTDLNTILEMNNFTLNDCEEASISCSFDNEAEVYTTLEKINQRSFIPVSTVVEYDSNYQSVESCFFFSIDNFDNETITDTILAIQSV